MNNKELISLVGQIEIEQDLYSSLAIFSKIFYEYNELKDNADKLKVPDCDKVPKYRPYLKVVKGNRTKEEIIQEQDILTFVLFNPSYANQFTLDDTIKNCAYVTSKKRYSGFEILNLLNIRNPNINNIIPNSIDNIYNCYFDIKDIIIFKNVVLAWGVSKNKYFNEMENSWNNFFKLFHKQDTKYFYLQKDSDKDKTRHLGNQGWNRGGCNFQNNYGSRIKLTSINNGKQNIVIKIKKSGKIETVYV